MTVRYPLFSLAAGLAMTVSIPALSADVTPQRLEAADSEPQNWLTVFQNYSSHRYSRLNEITRDNVAGLRVAFTVPISTALAGRAEASFEGAPLVDDGIMYLEDGQGVIYKIDVSAGNRASVQWLADGTVSKEERPMNRGIAMLGNRVYANFRDGRVVAVDRDTGEFVWDVQRARIEHPGGVDIEAATKSETFTAAPLAVENMLLVGQSLGDLGNRGWLEALNAETGEPIWRTYTIPKPGEPGSETWKDDHHAWKTGGGSLWTTGSYDPGQRITIWGTANPVPMFDPEYRPGDNLFTNSAIAFNIADGSMKWYFQYTPNDSWDYDEQGVHLLYDTTVNGETRKVVGHFARNGFYYQLDRQNGAFVTADKYVNRITWTAGIDPKTGMPVEYDPNLDLQTYIPGTRFLRGEEGSQPACPHMTGGARWQPPAYNPDKGLAYVGANDGCFVVPVIPVETAGENGGIDAQAPGARIGSRWADMKTTEWQGIIRAVNVTTGKTVAELNQPYENLSGILATSGGLIFSATADGFVTAHNDETLEQLWSFYTGIQIKAPPIAYSANGKQYIAIMAGAPAPGTQPFMFAHPELINMQNGAMLYVFSL